VTRVYVIHPGVNFSTSDVYTGLCAGLKAHGVEVVEGRLDEAVAFQTMLYEAGQAAGVVTPGKLNITTFASPYIVQHAIASEPDAVICVSAHNFNIASARTLRLAGLRTAVIMTESPYFASFERQMAPAYAHVFTNERKCATGAYFDHKSVHYLPHAYNPDVHRPEGPKVEPAPDVVFIGSLFEERARLFGNVDWDGVNFVRRGYAPGQVEQDIVDNQESAAYYRSVKINLNHHRTTTEFGSGEHIKQGTAQSLGPRAYEIAACGGFQLCDDSRAELQEVFRGMLPTYVAGDSADLSDKLRFYLEHDDLREDLARSQWECVQPHSWTARAKQVLEVVL
jgi:spore maturation protein CgeB